METDPPPEAITAAYAEFRNLYPQRMTPWDELAGWEQERWQRIIAAAAPAIRAAERERFYAELGNDHYVIFTKDRWTVEHSVECRLSGHMHECEYHVALRKVTGRKPRAAELGRWRVTIDSEGLPDLERADG